MTRDDRAVVSVRNTGPVIPPEEVDLLFQPFQRLGTERVQRSGGHGLGLAIVRAIAVAFPVASVDLSTGGGGRRLCDALWVQTVSRILNIYEQHSEGAQR